MATAVKRGNSFKITASCGYDISGKQIRKHTTWTPPAGMTPRQIAKELERQKVLFEERVNSGTTKDGNIRFEDFAAIWMKDFAQKQLKVKTYTGYEKSLVRINQAIGHIKLKDLRTGHLNEFYRNLEETGIRADLKYTSKIDIGEAIEQAGVTRTAFGKAAGVAGNTLRIAISGKRVSKETATAISEELGLKLSDAFRLEQPNRLLSSNTVRSYHRIISSCLGKAVKWGYIPYNPAVNAELPKMPKQEAAYLDEAEARQLLVLLHQEPIKYRAMITFDLLSGLRRGELLGLRWQDVDFENQTITIVNTLNYAPGARLCRHAEEHHVGPAAEALTDRLLDAPRVQAVAGRPARRLRRLLEGHGRPRIHRRRRRPGVPRLSDKMVCRLREAERAAGRPHSQPAPHLREPDDRRRYSAPRGLSQTGPCTGQHHGQYLRPRHSVGRREGRTDRREVCRRCDHSRGLSSNRQKKKPRQKAGQAGAGGVTRTPDLRITSALLYRLSYTSMMKAKTLFLRISTK